MKHILLASTAVIFLFATSGTAIAESSGHEETSAGSAQEHEIHWSYEGEGAPENWGKIKGEFKACRLGQAQSPINIVETINADLPALDIDYKPNPLTILNNGHAIQVNVPEGSTMTVDGQVFKLLQFHFHTPSEHTIHGKTFDMELHFVHKTDDGQFGVLAVMMSEGRYNNEIEKIWKYMPMEKSEAQTYDDVSIDETALLPQKMGYYRLMGSLTTPPCTEGVNWHVLANPIELSKEQLDKFKRAFSMNARPVQPANSRLIVMDK